MAVRTDFPRGCNKGDLVENIRGAADQRVPRLTRAANISGDQDEVPADTGNNFGKKMKKIENPSPFLE